MKQIILLLLAVASFAQAPFEKGVRTSGLIPYPSVGGIAVGSNVPNVSALLDLQGTTKGFLPPRLTTTQMNAIASPADGLLIFNTTEAGYFFYDGDSWEALTGGGAGAVSSVNSQTGDVFLTQDNIADGTTNKVFTATEKSKLAGIASGATANDTDSNLKNRANHTGTQPATTITEDSTHRFLTDTERTKLTGVASGATVNDTDANLKNRANHTGTQAASSISDFTAAAQTAVSTTIATKLDKSELYVVGKNKFDKTKVTTGFQVNRVTGLLVANASYSASDYIPVLPNTKYVQSGNSSTNVAYYTSAKVFISGTGTTTAQITTPATAAFLRMSTAVTHIDTAQLELDWATTTYEPYTYGLPPVTNVFAGKKWNALGDSMTNNAGYKELVKKYLEIGTLVNYGIGGTELVANNEYGSSMLNRIDAMDADADIITILGGINDFRKNELSIGTIADSPTTVSLYGGMRGICQKLIDRYPGKMIFIISPIQMGGSGVTSEGLNGLGQHLLLYRNVMKEVAELYGIPFIDLTSQSGITQRNISSYTTDSLHPNSAGSSRMAALIIEGLRKSLKY